MSNKNKNSVERKNYDSKASLPQSLRNGLIMLYKIDKATCAKNITAKMGHSISYIDKSIQKRQESAEKQRIQRKRKACETASSNEFGPPDRQGDFVLSTKRYYITWYLKWYCCIFALTIRSKPSKSNCQANKLYAIVTGNNTVAIICLLNYVDCTALQHQYPTNHLTIHSWERMYK